MVEKAPYKLTISLEGTRPEYLSAALNHLNKLCAEYDQVGESKVKVAIESWHEDALVAIRQQIELFMRQNKLILESKTTMEAPTVRPAPEKTPMEKLLDERQPETDGRIDFVTFRNRG